MFKAQILGMSGEERLPAFSMSYLCVTLQGTPAEIAKCTCEFPQCRPVIQNPPPLKGLNIRIPIIPLTGPGFVNQGSGSGFR